MVGARFEEGRIHYEPFTQDELVLAAPAGRTSVRLSELPGQSFVMRERGSGTRKVMERALTEHDVDPGGLRVVLELPGTRRSARPSGQAQGSR